METLETLSRYESSLERILFTHEGSDLLKREKISRYESRAIVGSQARANAIGAGRMGAGGLTTASGPWGRAPPRQYRLSNSTCSRVGETVSVEHDVERVLESLRRPVASRWTCPKSKSDT